MFEIYILIFLGVFFLGEVAWIPALYFSYFGKIDIQIVFLIGFFTILIANTFWYLLGRIISFKIFKFVFFKKKLKVFEKFFNLFNEKQFSIIFLSKFVYGTRFITQFLAGAYKINYAKFLATVSIASFIWSVFLLFLVYGVNATLGSIEEIFYRVQISISIFILIMIAMNFFIRRILIRKMTKNSE